MQRLVSLRVAVALALAVGLGAYFLGAHSGSIATAQAPILWKVQSAWPPTSIVQDGAKLLVETIEKNLADGSSWTCRPRALSFRPLRSRTP